MAIAPQKVTRIAPTVIAAPPARAASAPRDAKNTNEEAATAVINWDPGTIHATNKGKEAPMVKVPAEKNAACTGCAAADVVPGVRAERVMRHQFIRDLPGQRWLEPPGFVNLRKLIFLKFEIFLQRTLFNCQIGIFGV